MNEMSARASNVGNIGGGREAAFFWGYHFDVAN
jgi:hypothetical protein